MEVAPIPHNQDIAVFDEEVNAIRLQMEEIQLQQDFRKGKYVEGRAPDREVAIHDFEIELGRSSSFSAIKNSPGVSRRLSMTMPQPLPRSALKRIGPEKIGLWH